MKKNIFSIWRDGSQTKVYKNGVLIESEKLPKTSLLINATNIEGKPSDIKSKVYLCEHDVCKLPECECLLSEEKSPTLN